MYYHARGQPDESELKAAIAGVAGAYPTYGYRRITAQLQRQGYLEFGLSLNLQTE
ncbi:hypothetical protein AM1_0497 [Acaryochloris marina MBIC11017]|uniref:HTH-like domain-containing protein n=1 Tax=Acaryochloris marina (strain MBIC 11017) TaxID=329726 RepID=B0CC08_ACAM1|nr:hypothetical protein AM1_0497 [Acaryochloris marina MBIC11017]BDM80432.1 hypothetical protein AM10699_33000 [Acaryochloris marina MBIC10699]